MYLIGVQSPSFPLLRAFLYFMYLFSRGCVCILAVEMLPLVSMWNRNVSTFIKSNERVKREAGKGKLNGVFEYRNGMPFELRLLCLLKLYGTTFSAPTSQENLIFLCFLFLFFPVFPFLTPGLFTCFVLFSCPFSEAGHVVCTQSRTKLLLKSCRLYAAVLFVWELGDVVAEPQLFELEVKDF